ncbi:MAG TPA: hypothetical protein VF656_04405 [Pyrinomonadaceae bacterium]|jgi:hypothetical protein
MIKLKTCILYIGLMLCLRPALSVAQSPIGYVLEIEGDWHLNNDLNSTLSPGQKLPPSGTVGIRSPSRSDRIVIADMRGKIIAAQHCALQDCSKNFILPRSAPRRSMMNVIFSTAMELIRGAPDRYSSHRSRGGQLSDGVTKLEGRTLDLSQTLTETGQYYISWRVLPQGNEAVSEWSAPAMVEVSEGSPVTLSDETLKAGLYEFILLRRLDVRFVPDGGSAFILISPPSKFASSRESFRQATEMTQAWGDKVRPETKRRFLRAHLDGLAQQAAKRGT